MNWFSQWFLALLNRILVKTDEILTKQATLRNCTYSRYADDLTFSGDDKAVELIGIATNVLQKISLEIDPDKTNIFFITCIPYNV